MSQSPPPNPLNPPPNPQHPAHQPPPVAPGSPPPKAPCRDAGGSVTCQQCVDFLLDYVDGLLPDDQRFKFESHLAYCPDCETYLENYRKAAALAGGLGRPERAKLAQDVPAGLVRAILEARKRGG